MREKMGPGWNESPAGAMTCLALLSASSICFLVSPNRGGGNGLASPFLLFSLFSFVLPRLLLPSEAFAVGHDSLNLPRDFS